MLLTVLVKQEFQLLINAQILIKQLLLITVFRLLKLIKLNQRTFRQKGKKIPIKSKKSQTVSFKIENCRETLIKAFPNSPLLELNTDQFSRIITGNSRTPLSRATILQGLQLKSVTGTTGYNLLRSEIPKIFPSTSIIRNSFSSFFISPGPISSIIKLFCEKLIELPSYYQKIVSSFDEFSVAHKIEFSAQHNLFIGLPTLQPKIIDSPVQNCLIILAQCLTLPIRVPVSVDFTASSTKPGQ